MLNLERAEGLKLSYWDDVIEELEALIQKACNQLRHTSPEKLIVIQERIRTLEEIKGLPSQVIDAHSDPDTKE
jgi:hypothetical protein